MKAMSLRKMAGIADRAVGLNRVLSPVRLAPMQIDSEP